MEEIVFNKYQKRGNDYHYKQINKFNPFTFNAFVYARYYKHILLLKKALIEYKIDKNKELTLLDMGCGDGVLIYFLKKYLRNYKFIIYGIDLSKEALETARQKNKSAVFKQANVYDTGFDEQYFDIILSSDVIEHVKLPERMLKEAKRVAKQNALIVFGTPVRYTEFPLDKMHVKEFYPKELEQIFSDYFSNVKIRFSHKLFHVLRYQRNMKFLNKKIGLNRYIYFMLSYLSLNPFMQEDTYKKELFAYMYVIGINN